MTFGRCAGSEGPAYCADWQHLPILILRRPAGFPCRAAFGPGLETVLQLIMNPPSTGMQIPLTMAASSDSR